MGKRKVEELLAQIERDLLAVFCPWVECEDWAEKDVDGFV